MSMPSAISDQVPDYGVGSSRAGAWWVGLGSSPDSAHCGRADLWWCSTQHAARSPVRRSRGGYPARGSRRGSWRNDAWHL